MTETVVYRKMPIKIRLRHPHGFQWSISYKSFGITCGAMSCAPSYQLALTDARRMVGEVLSRGNNIQR